MLQRHGWIKYQGETLEKCFQCRKQFRPGDMAYQTALGTVVCEAHRPSYASPKPDTQPAVAVVQ